ncbi:MAG: hypothetical protein GXP16_12865, partial [Gammaproteobacteria bacterium]|nr:hypothetical protein [Gammaproteobacteria bacterium]
VNMDNELNLSELLALRDGEPYDINKVSSENQEVQMQTLQKLAALKADLNDLSNIPVDDCVWMGAEQNTPATNTQATKVVDWRHYPLATAASAFVVSAMVIFAIFGLEDASFNPPARIAAHTQIEPTAIRTAALMTQSRNLEQAFGGGFSPQLGRLDSPASSYARSTVVAILAYRVADVDNQIARLYESENVDPELRRELWQKRVELLEAYLGELATANPDVLSNSRSM